MAKRTGARRTAAAPMAFETEIIPNVPNDQVPARVVEIMQDPKYVAHNLLPEGPDTTTIIVIYRK